MNENENQANASGCGRAIKRTLIEALLVVAAGSVFALVANAISPHGLKLTRDYFPTAVSRPATAPKPVASVPLPAVTASNAAPFPHVANLTTSNPQVETAISNPAMSTNVSLPAIPASNAVSVVVLSNTFLAGSAVVETNAKGLQIISRQQAVDFLHDARYQQGRLVSVDARRESLYREGHIPGAYQFDPYQQEKYLPTVLPLCQAAEAVMVYCTGGDCEDSEYAAISLGKAGIANEKLYVYHGGIGEWASNSLPVELGARNTTNGTAK